MLSKYRYYIMYYYYITLHIEILKKHHRITLTNTKLYNKIHATLSLYIITYIDSNNSVLCSVYDCANTFAINIYIMQQNKITQDTKIS